MQQVARGRGERFAAVRWAKVLLEVCIDLSAEHFRDQIAAIDTIENALAIAVDSLALLVHHLVVLEQILADFEVALFNLLLCRFDAARHHAAFDRLAFFHAKAREQILHPLTGEDPHQVVFKRKIEAAAARIALATATAAELQVDAAGFMALSADDVQAAQVFHFLALGLHVFAPLDFGNELLPFVLRNIEARGVFILQLGPGHRLRVAAEDDIRTTAGHVRGDRHGRLPPGLRDDFGLTLVVFRVEHLVLDAALIKQARKSLALFDRNGAHQYGTAATLLVFDLFDSDRLWLYRFLRDDRDLFWRFVLERACQKLAVIEQDLVVTIESFDFVGNRAELLALAAVDHVRIDRAPQRSVGRHADDVELVDFPELGGFGECGACHAANLAVQLKKVLQRNRGKG